MRIPKLTAFFLRLLALASALAMLSACSDDGHDDDDAAVDPNVIEIAAGPNFESDLRETLFNAMPGNIIVLPAGEFTMASGLILDVDNVTIRGAGRDTTALNYSGSSGGDGVLVTSNNVVLENFAVIDAPGDAVKFKSTNGVTIRGLRVEWTCGACETNGAYGIYPVLTKNVLIEDSIVIGASDAGIYVGQSDNIIVRNNEALLNVAGIEIENSTRSDVYGNNVHDNTGGILAFDLPNLSQDGAVVRIFNNTIVNNNTPNFAPEGNIVGLVPTGTGMLLMAFDDMEVFDNVIENNQSEAIIIVTYDMAGRPTDDQNYDPNPRRANVHDNTYSNNSYDPQGMAALIGALFPNGMPDDIYVSGVEDAALENVDGICVREESSVKLGYVYSSDYATFADLASHSDTEFFNCAHASLPEVVLDTPEEIEEGERPPTQEEIAALCTASGTTVNFAAGAVNCPTLSGYNLFADQAEPRQGTNGNGIHYNMITPLFTDYASKYRFVFVPEGKQAAYSELDVLDFPVGTIIAKTFTMHADFNNPTVAGEDIIETRLMMRRADGWMTLPYIWRADGSDADLAIGGGSKTVSWKDINGVDRTTEYLIPDAKQCNTCHSVETFETGSQVNTQTVIDIIGLKARFLNTDNQYAGQSVNQLAYMEQQGILVGLPDDLQSINTVPDWEDPAANLEDRAKAYLDINCAHCHRPEGFASNSALFLEYWRAVGTSYGICKPPVAAGSGSGGLSFDIVPGNSDESILSYRMDSNAPGVRMPEIGRSIIHTESVTLVEQWINSLSGGCTP